MSKRTPTVLVNLSIMMTLAVVLLGGWTRVNDAGLSCPDWPGCYGEYIVPGTKSQQVSAQMRYPQYPMDLRKSWIEMTHRYLAGSLGLLIGSLALVAWRHTSRSGYPARLSWLLLGFVVLQGLFGMWTVTLKLQPLIVTLHLLGGLFTLSLLVRLRQKIDSWQRGRPWQTNIHKWWLRTALVLLFGQIALGGWTSANYARWACSHWMACEEGVMVELDYTSGFAQWQPVGPSYQGGKLQREARAAIQISHRIGALVVTGYIGGLLILLTRRYRLSGLIKLTGTVLLAQLLLGVMNVMMMPVWLSLAHLTGACVLLLCILQLYQIPAMRREEVSRA